MLLYGLASEQSLLARFLSTRALILGGEISYSMYLLRTPAHAWISLFPMLSSNRIVHILYIPLLLIPLSLMSYFGLKRPRAEACVGCSLGCIFFDLDMTTKAALECGGVRRDGVSHTKLFLPTVAANCPPESKLAIVQI